MKRSIASYITGLASLSFLMATTFDAQLFWNATKFNAPAQEIVEVGGKTYSINTEYNAVLKERHTDKVNGRYFDQSHKGNVRALSYFFGMIR